MLDVVDESNQICLQIMYFFMHWCPFHQQFSLRLGFVPSNRLSSMRLLPRKPHAIYGNKATIGSKVPGCTNGFELSRAKFSTSDGFGRKSTTASNSNCTPLFLRAEPQSIGVNARRIQLRRMAAWKSDKNVQSHKY